MQIQFHFQKQVSLQNRQKLKNFILSILKSEKQRLSSLGIIFCDDNYLLDINRSFLNHHYFTDTISFNLAESNQPVEGEIYISVDRIAENATLFNTTIKNELHRVIFHSVLHLCGYSDKTKPQQKKMRLKEDYYLNKYLH